MIIDKTSGYKKQTSRMSISVQSLISKQCYHDTDEGDEVVYNEVSDDIEKKAWAICSPMYNQRSGQLLSNEIYFCTVLGNN